MTCVLFSAVQFARDQTSLFARSSSLRAAALTSPRLLFSSLRPSQVTGTVYSGDLCAVMGPSGAGKTTLLDVVSKRKTEGKVLGKARLVFFSSSTGPAVVFD